MISLNSKIGELSRVGKVLEAKLRKLGIETVRDLIFYYPFRYDDFSKISKISEISPGELVTVSGKIEMIANRRSPRKRKVLTEAVVSDDSDSLRVVWFNQPWIGKSLKPGAMICLSGKVAGDQFNLFLNSPSYELNQSDKVNTARLVPIYSLTEGVSQKQIRYLIKSVLSLADQIDDFMPQNIVLENSLLPLARALKNIHFPIDGRILDKSIFRLSFDELFIVRLWSGLVRKRFQAKRAAKINFFEQEVKNFISNLKFKLTDDQKKVAWEIIRDIGKQEPMNRLVEGDVGSGKTIISIIASLNVLLDGFKVAFMAPTEVLAFQHFQTFRSLLSQYDFKCGLFTGSRRQLEEDKISRVKMLESISNGKIDILIGTHSLIQKDVDLKDFALVIADEQHRFGVDQRKMLAQSGNICPHFMSLTATPIPRSLALAIYGDLDISIIRQLPVGRKKIITKVVESNKRELAYKFLAEQVSRGRQVFVICPLIDPSDKSGSRSVKAEFSRLDKEMFPNFKIGMLHGRMKAPEKEKILADFGNKKIDVLVSTSVIEVGIDFPNASIMMIEGADSFGLAQLHQFRGRVGRGPHQSYCFLFSDSDNPKSLERLNVLVNCFDGFSLAEQDLKLRGAGQVYGQRQSGFIDLKIAKLDNLELINSVSSAVDNFLSNCDVSSFTLLQNKLDKLSFSDHLE